MNLPLLALRSLRHYWRTHSGVLSGTVLASAILTGALLVGDSVDYSLRRFAVLRLGEIHHALDAGSRYFGEALGDDLGDEAGVDTAAVLDIRGMAIHNPLDDAPSSQVNQVHVLGVDARFWKFAPDFELELAPGEVAINEKLATALALGKGGDLSLRVEKPGLLARDAPLSSRAEDTSRRSLLTVVAVVPDEALGRFSLAANQTPPYNAFVNRGWLQDQVELGRKANVLLAGGETTQEALAKALKKVWRPDYAGLSLREHDSGIVQLESGRVFIGGETARAALSIPGAKGTLSYLVKSLSADGKTTPYSFVTAGAFPGQIDNDEIIINRWLADEIGAESGDTVHMTYLELLPSNDFAEHSRDFRVAGIQEMSELTVEKELMPTFPGLSDVESCADWDVGMPMEDDLLADQANEAYWDAYGQTPKAFVTLAAGQEMWSNRFGSLTGVRYSGEPANKEALARMLADRIDPAQTGLLFQPVRKQAFDAVNKAMDFGGLFLGMSFFLILAALIFTALLFVFGVQHRAAEMGTLLALGYRAGQVRRLLLSEGAAIAAVGAVAGAWLGTLYTRVLIYGLAQYWQGAVASAAIRYYAAPNTLIVGAVSSFVCAIIAILLAIWRQTRLSARALLARDLSSRYGLSAPVRLRRYTLSVSVVCAAGAAAIVVYALATGVQDIVYPFFGAGALLLTSGLFFYRWVLSYLAMSARSGEERFSRLALRNVSRRSGRSLSVAGLLACGCFLVFAVSSMQEDVGAHPHARWSGTGGFELFAESTLPLLETPDVTVELPGVNIVPIKVREGDDASCLNLNHPQNPRLLGVSVEAMSRRHAFLHENAEDLWQLLEKDLPGGVIPAIVGDSDTAMWGLKQKTGIEDGGEFVYRGESGEEFTVRLVAKLPMRLSVFQGTVLISERHFTERYPSEDGYRMFLIDTPEDAVEQTRDALTTEFERSGMDVVRSARRLREFYAVESTYLAMFLVLGGLGLVLGSAGMGVVALRNLFERRNEIALFRAVGFTKKAVYGLALLEHGTLLLAGLGLGTVSAALSMLPAMTASESNVSLKLQGALLGLVLVCSALSLALTIRLGLPEGDVSALRDE